MTDPRWPAQLAGIHPVLATEDQRLAGEWDPDGPPLTIRLAALAHAFTEHAAEFSQDQRRELFGLLERELDAGPQADAVATGFFEALLNDYDRGFDLRSVWPDIGPQSRAYCLAWNEFTGVTSPGWMT